MKFLPLALSLLFLIPSASFGDRLWTGNLISPAAGRLFQDQCHMITAKDIREANDSLMKFRDQALKDHKDGKHQSPACEEALSAQPENIRRLENGLNRPEGPTALEREALSAEIALGIQTIQSECKIHSSKVMLVLSLSMMAISAATFFDLVSGPVSQAPTVFSIAKNGYGVGRHMIPDMVHGHAPSAKSMEQATNLGRKALPENLKIIGEGAAAVFIAKKIWNYWHRNDKFQFADKMVACVANKLALEIRSTACQKMKSDGEAILDQEDHNFRETLALLEDSHASTNAENFCQETACLWSPGQAEEGKSLTSLTDSFETASQWRKKCQGKAHQAVCAVKCASPQAAKPLVSSNPQEPEEGPRVF